MGQFPRHLHAILGPLLEVNNLIHIKAQALMEDRFLPTGVDVAFAVWYVTSHHITLTPRVVACFILPHVPFFCPGSTSPTLSGFLN